MKSSGLARIGRDVEVRQVGDTVCCSVSLAVTYIHKREKMTQWIDGTLWGARATSLAPYLLKGTQIVAHMSDMHIETFAKSDGTQATKLAGRIDDIDLPDRKDAGQTQQQQTAPAQRPQAAPAPRAQPARAATAGADDWDDDSIPF